MRDLSGETTPGQPVDAAADAVVVRRSEHGWQVGDEQTADLTSAMVLADLLAGDLGGPMPTLGPPAGTSGRPMPTLGPPAGTSGPRRSTPASEEDEAARLAVTVAQLEHALAARVRVEQAIGVLAERHRLRPRQAFDLLRSVARSAGGVSPRSRRTWWKARPTRCCRCPRNWPGSRPRRASAAARRGQGGSGGKGLSQRGSGGMGPPGRSSGATWGAPPRASTNVGGRRYSPDRWSTWDPSGNFRHV